MRRSSYTVWGALKLYALAVVSDDEEHYLCRACGREYSWLSPQYCVACGGEITVQLDRASTLALASQELRWALFPVRMTDWSSDAPRVAETLSWRGHDLFTRMVDNPFQNAETPEGVS